jgi:hypothetical protein
MNYSAEGLGLEIRDRRKAVAPRMSQEELGRRAEYGKGAAVSISRIEHGLMSPGDLRLAGIASALGMTPEQLRDEAVRRTQSLAAERGGQEAPKKFRERVADTKARHAAVAMKVGERTKITQELGEVFNEVHDVARDQFFMRFVELGETIQGAPEADMPSDEDLEPSGKAPAAARVEAMTAGIATAIRGAATGGAAGAAAGGAAAYGAFTAVAMFGTASTGAAISTLTGVAASNATLAILGGGTLAAGGAGMAGGALLLTGMVAAPAAALAAAGFYMVKQRRTKQEEERLRHEVASAEMSLNQSQAGFDAMADTLQRAAILIEYVSVHGAHALSKWQDLLPAEPRQWDDLGEEGRTRYNEFLTVAGCLMAISSINVGALLTATPDELPEMVKAIDGTLRYADRTVRRLV